MKLGRTLYLIAVILMAAMAYIFLRYDMDLLGLIFTLVSFSAIVNYLSIEEQNKEEYVKQEKRRYLEKIYSEEKEYEEVKKKYEHMEHE